MPRSCTSCYTCCKPPAQARSAITEKRTRTAAAWLTEGAQEPIRQRQSSPWKSNHIPTNRERERWDLVPCSAAGEHAQQGRPRGQACSVLGSAQRAAHQGRALCCAGLVGAGTQGTDERKDEQRRGGRETDTKTKRRAKTEVNNKCITISPLKCSAVVILTPYAQSWRRGKMAALVNSFDSDVIWDSFLCWMAMDAVGSLYSAVPRRL